MASNSAPPPNSADDWQVPQPAPGQSPQPPGATGLRGSWESNPPGPAQPPAGSAGGWQSVGDALRAPFGALWSDPSARPIILVSLLFVVAVCGLSCFVLSLALISNGGLLLGGGQAAQPASTPVATEPITSGVSISANATPVPAGVPSRLTIRNLNYAIKPMQHNDKGEWQYDKNAAHTAFWAVGSYVNYVLGMQASDENKQVFESLHAGDLLMLETAIGTLRYRVDQVTAVPKDDPALVSNQSRPQLTLMLMDEPGDTRRVVVAPYTDEATANSVTTLGVPINLGDVRVTALSARLIPGVSAGLPADQSYFQVNVQISSLVTRVLDAAQFTVQLVDGAGAIYPLSGAASQASGGLGWTSGALSPGQTITATSGFQVPAGMPGPRLEWNFATDPGNPYIARVTLPYETVSVVPTLPPTEAPVAEVTLLNVNISPEGNELRIVGSVRNLTSRFLAVSLRDFSLASSGNPIALNASLPALPWNITPGETLAFQLTYARPPGGAPVIFTMFGQSYEINGL